jgi:hypothetical protein
VKVNTGVEKGRVRWSPYLDMLLQILRALEGLAAELALMRLERNVNADVRSDVVTLDSGGAARVPLAGEVEVVGALAANVALTDVLLELESASLFSLYPFVAASFRDVNEGQRQDPDLHKGSRG